MHCWPALFLQQPSSGILSMCVCLCVCGISVCMCVHKCVHVCVRMHVHLFMHVELILGDLLSLFLLQFWGQGLPLTCGIPVWLSYLASKIQGAIHFLPNASAGVEAACWVSKLRSSCWRDRHFNDRYSPSAYCLIFTFDPLFEFLNLSLPRILKYQKIANTHPPHCFITGIWQRSYTRHLLVNRHKHCTFDTESHGISSTEQDLSSLL